MQYCVVLRYKQPEFKEGEFNVASMATTTIFYVSCFQYLMLAFALSKGPPYRRRIWTNSMLQLHYCQHQKYVFELVDIERTGTLTYMLQVFISKCLRRILVRQNWSGASAGPNMKNEMELAWTHFKKK